MVVAFFICFALLFSTLVMTGSGRSSAIVRDQTRRGNPEPGRPEMNLPNLDEVRRKRHPRPETPAALPSLTRSRRKPLLPRNGRKVGDAFTGSESNGITQSLPAAGGKQTIPDPAVISLGTLSASHAELQATRRHHSAIKGARPNGALPQPPPITDDDYVARWYSYALTRTAYAAELAYWDDLLRAAYAHNQSSMVMAAREMGKTLFESAEYALRGRSDHDYIYDLYKTYLMRSPDSGGWAYWESLVPGLGRENVRRAFDESGEFISKVGTVTLTGNASSTVTSLLSARTDLNNQSGNQVMARDAEWSSTLVSLPGRAGLDLGLAISYSSAAVWTRSGPYIYFDDDNSYLSPGFRLGFPTVQEQFFNAQTGQNAYLLITSAGSRAELRQLGTTNVYEAVDSSYLQLTDTSAIDGKLLLRSTDGMRMTYNKVENEWRCKEAKDRNGNYLTINYNSSGDLTSVVDTLGRTITFVYDGNANLSEIQQTWHRDLQSRSTLHTMPVCN
jgi:YD repeat-containing protein